MFSGIRSSRDRWELEPSTTQDDEFIRMCLVDLYQELVHLLSVHVRADLPVQSPLHRADRSIDEEKRFLDMIETTPARALASTGSKQRSAEQ